MKARRVVVTLSIESELPTEDLQDRKRWEGCLSMYDRVVSVHAVVLPDVTKKAKGKVK